MRRVILRGYLDGYSDGYPHDRRGTMIRRNRTSATDDLRLRSRAGEAVALILPTLIQAVGIGLIAAGVYLIVAGYIR